jgi:hypothetical protein
MTAHGSAPSPSVLRRALRSWPEEKCLPSPASTSTRTSSSASARSRAASISSIMRLSWALATSGRLIVIVATGPSTSYRMVS